MKTLLGFTLLVLYTFSALAWGDMDLTQFGHRIEQAGYREDAQELEAVRATLEAATANPQADRYAYYYLGYVDYSLAHQYFASDSDKATDRADAAQEALKRALKLDPNFAEAEALLGASYSIEMGLHPMKGLFLGGKTAGYFRHALATAPGDPRVILLNAIEDYQLPAAFGGDKQRAADGLRRALAAFDNDHPADATAPAWGKALAYQWLGFAEASAGQPDAARADYIKALNLAPDYKKASTHLDKLPPPAAKSAGSI